MTVEEWLGKDNQIGLDIWHKKYQYNGESFDEWLTRVSNADTEVEELIKAKKFLYAGRILANRGLDREGKKITLSNCYVVDPPGDNIESIFECAKKLARTYSYGGGCGVDISNLAPRGAKINNAAKETSGAVSFMDLYSMVTGLIGQEGRRGALMISLDCNHPDLEEFIGIKSDLTRVTKANISIRLTDDFMRAVETGDNYTLSYIREATGEVVEKVVNAKELFYKIAEMNWRTAEPGVLYWDKIKNWNLLSDYDNFEFAGVNPCSEEPLPAGGSCLLGSINLSEFVVHPFSKDAVFDYQGFGEAVCTAVKTLNDVLDEGQPLHPLEEQRTSVRDWRQIGLGIMGLADMLIKMGCRYGSVDALRMCNKISSTFLNAAIVESTDLAAHYGHFPKFDLEKTRKANFYKNNLTEKAKRLIELYGLRNSQLLTTAPTGTLSTMLGISGGIEPIFATSYTRKTETLNGKDTFYKIYTPIVKQYITEVLRSDPNNFDEGQLPEYFVTSERIPYKDRIGMQSVWQQNIDASISSTVNLPETATIEDVADLYMYAWSMGLKGITVYRANCERAGVLTTEPTKKEVKKKYEVVNSTNFPRGMIEDVPAGLTYRKYKIKSGCGALYLFVGVDEDEGRIYDFFTNTDGVGGCTVSTQANSRLMSACIRGGVPITYMIEQLQKAGTCPSFQYARGKGEKLSRGRSCPSAIAYILQDVLDELKRNLEDESADEEVIKPSADGGICPECGEHEVVHEGGCLTCKHCGWSKCS